MQRASRDGAGETGFVPGLPGRDPLSTILDLDADLTLAQLRAGRRTAWRVEAEQMVAATHWADLHRLPVPAPDDPHPDLGSMSRETVLLLQDPSFESEGRTWASGPGATPGPDGIEGVLRLLGEGCYLVSEFAVTELATTLGMTETGGRGYLGQSLECRDRLPRIWAAVLGGTVPAWKARQIAKLTLPLNAEAADFVDRSLHQVAGRIGLVRITRAVEAAILRFDPALAAERAEQAAERRGVWVGPAHGGADDEACDGLRRVGALVDTPDAEAFELAVADIAAALGALGDEDSLSVRRARAVGILADPRHALDVDAAARSVRDEAPDQDDLVRTARAEDPRQPGRRAERRPGRGPGPRRGPVAGRSLVVDLHVHLDPDRSDGPEAGAADAPFGPVVRQADLRAVSRAAVERWLRHLAPGAAVRVRPVVDVGADIAVDAHEVPVPIADQVDERDLTCQFPWCGRRAGPSSADRDHIEPYVDPDDGGPPGQTSARRLARLCRYHHRVKTHGGWHYLREPDGALTWMSPHGHCYRVDRRGSTTLDGSGSRPVSWTRGSRDGPSPPV